MDPTAAGSGNVNAQPPTKMPNSQLLEGTSICMIFKQPAMTAIDPRLLVSDIQMGSASFLDEFDQSINNVQHDSLSVTRCLAIGWKHASQLPLSYRLTSK
jgi:hypothetical protein